MGHRLELFTDACCVNRAAAIALGQRVASRLAGMRFLVRALAGSARSDAGERIWCSPTWVFDGRVISVGLPTFEDLTQRIRAAGSLHEPG